MKKNKKIVMYGGAFILSTMLVAGGTLAIYDTTVDHTKEMCPITHILNVGEGITTGIEHQQKQMNEESGLNYVYAADYERYKNTEMVIDVTVKVSENGDKMIYVPAGYNLVYIDGKPYGIKKTTEKEVMGEALVAFDQNGEELGCLKLG